MHIHIQKHNPKHMNFFKKGIERKNQILNNNCRRYQLPISNYWWDKWIEIQKVSGRPGQDCHRFNLIDIYKHFAQLLPNRHSVQAQREYCLWFGHMMGHHISLNGFFKYILLYKYVLLPLTPECLEINTLLNNPPNDMVKTWEFKGLKKKAKNLYHSTQNSVKTF